jgi:hypothetical protein
VRITGKVALGRGITGGGWIPGLTTHFEQLAPEDKELFTYGHLVEAMPKFR